MDIELEIKKLKKKLDSEYGDNGFKPNLASDVKRELRESLERCAAMCEIAGDETFSYTWFVVAARELRSGEGNTK